MGRINWKVSILVIVIIALATAALTVRDIRLPLGIMRLDRGGITNTILTANFETPIQQSSVQTILNNMGYPENTVRIENETTAIIRLPELDREEQENIRGILAQNLGPIASDNTEIQRTGGPLGLRLGLDLQGGSHLIYEATDPNATSEQIEGVLTKIERRVNAFGVAEPMIQRLGDNRIIVQLPGVKDIEQAKQLIGKTARLEIKERNCPPATDDPLGTCIKFTDKELGLTGDDLIQAYAGTNSQTGQAVVNLRFNNTGAQIIADLSKRLFNESPEDRMVFFLDNQELLAPVFNSPILDGSGIIQGPDFTIEKVRTLAIQLESGRLDVPLRLIKESAVDATLGVDSLNKSLTAGLIGFALVLLFMIMYYKLPGLISALALIVYAVVTLAAFKLIPVTLTLAGVAAFVLSIGMAVDANILIFERTKEELRRGRTLSSAIQVGFNRAWTSIRDSNVSTLITCAILYWFGSRLGAPLVMGFALTLAIGVTISMFTAITVSRSLFHLLGQSPFSRRIGLFLPGPQTAKVAPSETARGE